MEFFRGRFCFPVLGWFHQTNDSVTVNAGREVCKYFSFRLVYGVHPPRQRGLGLVKPPFWRLICKTLGGGVTAGEVVCYGYFPSCICFDRSGQICIFLKILRTLSIGCMNQNSWYSEKDCLLTTLENHAILTYINKRLGRDE